VAITCSVVLAAYQGQRFIDEQLDSIVAQLGPDDEIIISDDASSDETLDVVRRRNDPRIRVLENLIRVGYAMNFQRAINEVRGQYVFFSDQDDVWLPGKVAEMRAVLASKSFAASDAIVVNERLEPMYKSYFAHRGARSFSWTSLFLKPSIIGATMSCRKDYLQSLLPLPTGIPHDFWLTLNAAWDQELAIIERPLILYRRHTAAHSPTATERTRSFATIGLERFNLARAMVSRRFL
jgi:glycosyltransferase involved in cell wall biosynthesis